MRACVGDSPPSGTSPSLPASRSSSSRTSSRLAGAIVTAGRADQNVSVEPELLLDIFSHVRVIPVDPGVGKAELVGELAARSDGRLRELGRPIVLLSSRMPCQWTEVG